jgi:hypothetical protein
VNRRAVFLVIVPSISGASIGTVGKRCCSAGIRHERSAYVLHRRNTDLTLKLPPKENAKASYVEGKKVVVQFAECSIGRLVVQGAPRERVREARFVEFDGN